MFLPDLVQAEIDAHLRTLGERRSAEGQLVSGS